MADPSAQESLTHNTARRHARPNVQAINSREDLFPDLGSFWGEALIRYTCEGQAAHAEAALTPT